MVQKWFGGFNGPDRSRLVKIGPDWSRSVGWNLDQSGVLSQEIWTNLDLPRPEEQRCKNGWHSLASETVRGPRRGKNL